MAKYTITHVCGHTSTADLWGTVATRQSRADKLGEKPCPACLAAARQAEHAAQSTKAAQEAQAAGLPALTGSPKQIAWAETLRAEALQRAKDAGADETMRRMQAEIRAAVFIERRTWSMSLWMMH